MITIKQIKHLQTDNLKNKEEKLIPQFTNSSTESVYSRLPAGSLDSNDTLVRDMRIYL